MQAILKFAGKSDLEVPLLLRMHFEFLRGRSDSEDGHERKKALQTIASPSRMFRYSRMRGPCIRYVTLFLCNIFGDYSVRALGCRMCMRTVFKMNFRGMSLGCASRRASSSSGMPTAPKSTFATRFRTLARSSSVMLRALSTAVCFGCARVRKCA
jgi:hypothetical protein